jgi:hypothetical protein
MTADELFAERFSLPTPILVWQVLLSHTPWFTSLLDWVLAAIYFRA